MRFASGDGTTAFRRGSTTSPSSMSRSRGRTISLRPGDIKLSAPFGFASYNSTGALRKIDVPALRYR